MNLNTVRAWKDAEYRESLSADELALLPENPIGAVELSDEEAADIIGGGGSDTCCANLSVCVNSALCSVVCNIVVGL